MQFLASAIISDPSTETPTATATATVTQTPTKTATPTITQTPTNTPAWPEATPTPRPVLGSLTGITRESIAIDICNNIEVISARLLADASGTVDVPIGRIDGYLLLVVIRADPSLVATDDWDLQLLCERTGHDSLGSAGANINSPTTTVRVPLPVAGSTQVAPAIGVHYIRADNMGAGHGALVEIQVSGRASGPPESSP
jgi:hypothetical protein